MQAISEDLIAAARKGKRDAVVELLALHYPLVWRMATGLTGRSDVGRGVAKFVMQRSLKVLHNWKDETAPTRWFLHHTVLATRRAAKHQPDLRNDTFLRARQTDPAYMAFVRGLRALPIQQREAFILTHCENLEMRALAVAMDCSTAAATNHLHVANDQLSALATTDYAHDVQAIQHAYRTLTPEEEMSLKDIRRNVGRMVLPWLIARAIKFILSLVLLMFSIWLAWWVWKVVKHSMD
jgi:DNA-directed RNA polymerase specialized sigma24 family protein